MVASILCLLALFVQAYGRDESTPWEYHGHMGPTQWYKKFPICGKNEQSPIDIPEDASYYDMEPIVLKGFDDSDNYMLTFVNNGHSVQLNIDGEVYVYGGGLPGMFKTQQLHFHWGSDVTKGSEHTCMGNSYPMEMHVVSWNTNYQSIKEAATQSDGLAVLAVWMEVERHNEHLQRLVNVLSRIQSEGAEKLVRKSLSLRELLPRDLEHFYRYYGSLTTPPCYQSVIWTIFREKTLMSQHQLLKFRNVFKKEETRENIKSFLKFNHRPTQPLNDREVLQNFHGTCEY